LGFLAPIALAAAVAGGAPRPVAESAFDECEAAVSRAPVRYDSYLCYFLAGERARALSEAAARLDRLRAQGRGGGWPILVRAHVASSGGEGPARATELYREAADRLAAEGQALGEVIARTNLRRLHLDAGDRPAAAAQVERALRVAQGSGDREALVRASVLEASHLTDLGEDLGRAHRALRRAEAAAFPEGAPGLQQSVLRRSANLSYQLGRYEEAVEKLERLLALTHELGNRGGAAALRYNILNNRRAQREERPVENALAEVRGLAEQALGSAQEEEDRAVAARTHAVMAELLSVQDPARAVEHARRCLEIAGGLDRRLPLMECLSAMARYQASRRPAQSRGALDRAARIALAEENDVFSAYVWQARLRTAWDTHPPFEAAKQSLQALEAIERLRGAQGDPEARIHVLANWTKDYYWLAGRALGADPPDPGLAFAVVERMRARVLLEALEAAGLERAQGAAPRADALGQTLSGIVVVQRQLLDPSLAEDTRKALLAELERLELDEAELRAHAENGRARGAIGHAPRVTVGQVQAGLRSDEMLLVFLLGLDRDLYGAFGGGGWALAITRDRVAAWRVPDRMRLEATVPVLAGLLDRRDGSEVAVAAALYRDLFGGAGRLVSGVRRLVIVPDGILHELPFAALRPGSDRPPLGALYEIALVPSATLWTRWRSRPAARAPGAALVVADPESPSVLGPLPHARREGRRVRSAVGGGSRLLVGADATEAALKASPLAGFGLIHFATHAVADEVYPDRSAVVLSPGSDSQDGLLQPREVSALELSARAVVLSACRTAAGPVASGEGVLSLARSFFQAGARTVVASRSRLRDDEAERLFHWFYGHLRRGQTMGASLRQAREQAIADGMPAATWASVDLLGDPDFSLAASAPARATWPALLFIGAAVLALGLLGWGVVTRFAGR
jgi:tetratricopeptide (TPR) repeat protein